jgi:large subunit ribosomal protein L24
MKLKIKKDDEVKIIAGSDRGKTGRVLEVYPEKMRILVDGINIRKKHMRPSQANPDGGIMETASSIHYSNVQKI